jgi:endoglucanase
MYSFWYKTDIVRSFQALTSPVLPRSVDCETSFSPISASDFVQELNPGWNLGNTLDGIPDEGSWGNVASPQIFAAVKAAGFKSVRIPGM